MKWLHRMASLLYRRVFTRFPALRSQGVRTALKRTGQGGRKQEERYYTAKIAKVLAVLLAGSVIVLLARIAEIKGSLLTPEGTLPRASYGGHTTSLSLQADTEDGTPIGTFDVEVLARQYTGPECFRMFEEAADILPSLIAGDNPSLNAVSRPLQLVQSVPGYPFRITWATSRYFRLRTDGTPVTDDVAPEGEEVVLTATFALGEEHFEKEITVRVVPEVLSEQERAVSSIREEIARAEEDTRYEEEVRLPGEIGGSKIVWSEIRGNTTPALILLVIIGAVLVYFAEDRTLQHALKRREEELMRDYPGFVSKLALYLGAGMTVRGIFQKLAADAEAARLKGKKMTFLSEEIRIAVSELSNGTPESAVYEHFAVRTGLAAYTRLCSLLNQNLRKGSTELLTLMRAESAQAVRERMDRARVRGEQAATRLMLPMMLMLAVVMVLIMVPAYLSF